MFWGTTWELGQPFGNLMGTNREHDGNKEKKPKIPPHGPSQKEKNWNPHAEPFIGCMELILVVPLFWKCTLFFFFSFVN
jgi:hypothetical protein